MRFWNRILWILLVLLALLAGEYIILPNFVKVKYGGPPPRRVTPPAAGQPPAGSEGWQDPEESQGL